MRRNGIECDVTTYMNLPFYNYPSDRASNLAENYNCLAAPIVVGAYLAVRRVTDRDAIKTEAPDLIRVVSADSR